MLKKYNNNNGFIYQKLFSFQKDKISHLLLPQVGLNLQLLCKFLSSKEEGKFLLRDYSFLENILTKDEVKSLLFDLKNINLINFLEEEILENLKLLYFYSSNSNDYSELQLLFYTLRSSFWLVKTNNGLLTINLEGISFEKFKSIYFKLSLLDNKLLIKDYSDTIKLSSFSQYELNELYLKIKRDNSLETYNIIQTLKSITFEELEEIVLEKNEEFNLYKEKDSYIFIESDNSGELFEKISFFNEEQSLNVKEKYYIHSFGIDHNLSMLKPTFILSKESNKSEVYNKFILLKELNDFYLQKEMYFYSQIENNQSLVKKEKEEEFYNEIRKNQITLIYDTELNTFIKGEEYVEKYNLKIDLLLKDENSLYFKYNRIDVNNRFWIFSSIIESEIVKDNYKILKGFN